MIINYNDVINNWEDPMQVKNSNMNLDSIFAAILCGDDKITVDVEVEIPVAKTKRDFSLVDLCSVYLELVSDFSDGKIGKIKNPSIEVVKYVFSKITPENSVDMEKALKASLEKSLKSIDLKAGEDGLKFINLLRTFKQELRKYKSTKLIALELLHDEEFLTLIDKEHDCEYHEIDFVEDIKTIMDSLKTNNQQYTYNRGVDFDRVFFDYLKTNNPPF